MENDTKLLTVTQAAAELGIDASAIRHRLLRGHMKGERIAPSPNHPQVGYWLLTEEEVARAKAAGPLPRGRAPSGRWPPRRRH